MTDLTKNNKRNKVSSERLG